MFGGKQVVVCGYGEVNSWASASLSLVAFSRNGVKKSLIQESIVHIYDGGTHDFEFSKFVLFNKTGT